MRRPSLGITIRMAAPAARLGLPSRDGGTSRPSGLKMGRSDFHFPNFVVKIRTYSLQSRLPCGVLRCLFEALQPQFSHSALLNSDPPSCPPSSGVPPLPPPYLSVSTQRLLHQPNRSAPLLERAVPHIKTLQGGVVFRACKRKSPTNPTWHRSRGY